MPSFTVTAALFRAVYVLVHATLICLCTTAGTMSSFAILIIIQTFLWDAWLAKFMLMQALLFALTTPSFGRLTPGYVEMIGLHIDQAWIPPPLFARTL